MAEGPVVIGAVGIGGALYALVGALWNDAHHASDLWHPHAFIFCLGLALGVVAIGEVLRRG